LFECGEHTRLISAKCAYNSSHQRCAKGPVYAVNKNVFE
jgi:hypothetical protein